MAFTRITETNLELAMANGRALQILLIALKTYANEKEYASFDTAIKDIQKGISAGRQILAEGPQ